MSAQPDWDSIAKGKEEKKRLVIEQIAARCIPESPFDDLREIGAALQDGDKLEIDVLTGGLANYTYKVSTASQKKALFAKLSFPYGQLFPDKPCPLTRTENEYQMMKKFQALAPGCVATPYFCIDIDDDQKLLVTEWSKADEQWGNQFIDGVVDVRCAKVFADCISALHCSKVDKNFNEAMRPFFKSLTPIIKGVFDSWFGPEAAKDRVCALGNVLGKEKCDAIHANYENLLDTKDCLVHGDLHVFNIMVGRKPNAETLTQFDKEAKVVLCDYEVAHASTAGNDLGPFQAFPLSCAMAHAINQDKQAALGIKSFLDTVWDEYIKAMKTKGGKTDEEICRIYRDSLAFTGFYALAYYGLNIHMEFLPIDESNVEDLEKVKESIGMIGLKCFVLGCGSDDEEHTLDQLRYNVAEVVENEMQHLLAMKKPRRNRRSSVLRMSGRRVSDAYLKYGMMDRLSFVSHTSE